MVERALRFFHKEIRGLHEAAYLLGAFALLSQLLALLRDRLFAHSFGAGELLDVYYASFRVPDLIFTVTVSFVSVYILIPFLAERASVSREAAKQFLDSIATAFLGVAAAAAALAALFAPQLLSFLFPELSSSPLGESLLLMTRILLLQPILLGLSSLLGSATQVYRKFILYALSPVLYNVGIIAGLALFYPMIGSAGLAWGVVLGAFLHLLIQVPFMLSEGLLPALTRKIEWSAVRSVVEHSLPRTLALAASQLVVLVFIVLAARMAEGSISVFTFAFNLQAVPLAIVGVSYSVAAFPALAKLFTEGNRAVFLDHVAVAAKHILFWSFPIVSLLIVLRAQIVRVVLGTGAFDWADTRLTAAALALLAISVAAQGVVLLFARAFYAAGDTKKPLLAALISGVVALCSAFYLTRLFAESGMLRFFIEALLRVSDISGTEVLVLPLAYSLGSVVNALLLFFFFKYAFPDLPAIFSRGAAESAAASIVLGSVAYSVLSFVGASVDLDTFSGIFIQGLSGGLAGIFAGALVLLGLQNKELSEVFATVRKRFWKTPALASDQGL